jgi:hypothetical protein
MALGAFRGMTRQAAATAARSGVVLAVCLVAALALTACGSSRRGQPVPVVSATDLAATPETTTAETAPSATTETAALPGDLPADDSALPPETYETAEPADPDAVMGLDRTEVEALLGEPGLVRREAPAEVWQYESRGCVLDVFLYEASTDFQVVYLEARDGQAIAAITATCLGAVMDQRRRTPTS